jgi:predicted MPP superfamily phosphohydrolase
MSAQIATFKNRMAAAAVAALALCNFPVFGQAGIDKGFTVFVSDTHISEKGVDEKGDAPDAASRLVLCVQKILAKKPYPGVIIFCGDLTQNGRPEQMARFRTLIQPLRDAGIACRLMTGNHDYYHENGAHYRELFKEELAQSAVSNKVVGVVETELVDIVCLDTPDMVTEDGWWGRIDGAQLEWLKAYMQKHDGQKPYFICTHNNYQLLPVPAGVNMFTTTAGIISGHAHRYGMEKVGRGVPQVFIPSTFTDPFGYVEMRPKDGGFTFTLITEDEKHARNGTGVTVEKRTEKAK